MTEEQWEHIYTELDEKTQHAKREHDTSELAEVLTALNAYLPALGHTELTSIAEPMNSLRGEVLGILDQW